MSEHFDCGVSDCGVGRPRWPVRVVARVLIGIIALCGLFQTRPSWAQQEADAARLKEDIGLYAETNACGEEPLADRLRAAVLLAEADRGRSAQHIRETRQAFLDAWRERARRGEPKAQACRSVIDQAQARVDALHR